MGKLNTEGHASSREGSFLAFLEAQSGSEHLQGERLTLLSAREL